MRHERQHDLRSGQPRSPLLDHLEDVDRGLRADVSLRSLRRDSGHRPVLLEPVDDAPVGELAHGEPRDLRDGAAVVE